MAPGVPLLVVTDIGYYRLCTTTHIYPSALQGACDRSYAVGSDTAFLGRYDRGYADCCIRTSENTYSSSRVNKHYSNGRGADHPRRKSSRSALSRSLCVSD